MNNSEHPDDLLNAAQAAEYLRRKWNLDSWGVNDFRQYRYRLRKKGVTLPTPFPQMPNSTVWRRSDLDALPPLDETKRRSGQGNDNPLDSAKYSMLSYA